MQYVTATVTSSTFTDHNRSRMQTEELHIALKLDAYLFQFAEIDGKWASC